MELTMLLAITLYIMEDIIKLIEMAIIVVNHVKNMSKRTCNSCHCDKNVMIVDK